MTNKSIFSKSKKDTLPVNKEISSNGLSWRKLSDGTGVWRYDVKINNTRKKGVLGKERDGITLSQARAEFEDLKARLRLESTKNKKNPHSLGCQLFVDAAENFLVWSKVHHSDFKHNKSRMNLHLIPKFGKNKLEDIMVSDVEDLKTDLLVEKELSVSTVKKIISLMSSVYEHAAKKDRALINPTRGISKFRTTPNEIKIYRDDEIEDLLTNGVRDSRDMTIVGLARFAGLRASETLGLDWKDVDLKKEKMLICQSALERSLRKTTKSGKSRWVCIPEKLKEILTQRLGETGGSGLVVSPDGDAPYYSLQKIFRKIKERAEVQNDAGYHGLRHTFATRAIEKGVTLPMVQKWMGHSCIETTMRYVHVSDAHSNDMAALLN